VAPQVEERALDRVEGAREASRLAVCVTVLVFCNTKNIHKNRQGQGLPQIATGIATKNPKSRRKNVV
jgi:hypothetical protein